MPHAQKIIIMLCAVVLMAIAGLVLYPSQYRVCGHKKSLLERCFPHLPLMNHHCEARCVTGYFSLLHREQERAQAAHESPSSPLPTMHDFMVCGTFSWEWYPVPVTFEGSGKDWECRVNRTPDLPGHYLMTRDGTIYFNENHPATTQDVVLSEKLGE